MRGRELKPGDRKMANRRFNERLKLVANLLNALAIGVGTAIVIPAFAAPAVFFSTRTASGFFMCAALHLIAQGTLVFLRSEE